MLLAMALVQLKAQEHLRFMNTPIEGTMKKIAVKMETKGFVLDYAKEYEVKMKVFFIRIVKGMVMRCRQ